jgi:two-component system invasion response regulator UvrY
MEKISLIIVDDHMLIRETWSLILNGHSDFKVIAETGNGEEAVELCKLHKPDIVMMDINLPGMSGVDATKEIIKASPGTKVVGISLHNQPAYAKKMMKAGARGYITKNSKREEMLEGLLEVAKGQKYICKEIKNILSEEMLVDKKEKTLDLLSLREKEVIKHLIKGASSREIAELMFISVKTVEVHRYNILKKLELRNAAQLVNYINSQVF